MSEIIRLPPLLTIRELLKIYRIRALKKLSQNFLLQPRLTDKIVNAAGSLKEAEVLEIGPGPGSITRSILYKEPRKVILVEKDTRFQPILECLEHAVPGRVSTYYSDIRGFDLSDVFDSSLKKDWDDEPPNIHIIGNLPFSVANVVIFEFLRDISLRKSAWSYGRVCMTLTFQEEVARRMVAEILMKARGRISIMCQNWCKVSYKFSIPGRAFLPKPEVNVGVVHFEPLKKPIIDLEFRFVERVLRTIFNTRQKYLLNSAEKLFPREVRDTLVKDLLDMAEIHPHLRPYQITNEEYKRLCFAYKEICDKDPRLYSYDFRAKKKIREEIWKETKETEEKEISYSY